MNRIEDVVRRSMRAQVSMPPAMQHPADHALRKADTARRRHTAASACAGMLAVALGVAGFVVLRDSRGEHGPLPTTTTTAPPTTTTTAPPTGDPSPTAPANAAVILERRELLLPDGQRIPLDQIDVAAADAYQTQDGWLVRGYRFGSTEPEAASLWLVKPDRSLHRLVERSMGSVAVAPDGRRFAWRAGDRLHVGHLSGDEVTVDRSVPARSERAFPIVFTGTAVVLGYSDTGGGVGHWDTWLPDRGDYEPSEQSASHVQIVYPPAPDGSLVGLISNPTAPQGSKNYCLARLDPADNLRATRTACEIQLTTSPWPAISPDGRWLSVDAGQNGVGVLDLTAVFDRPAVAFTWDVQPTGAWVWVDATTMVAPHSDGGLRRLHIGSAPEPVSMPGLPPGAQLELVPRLP
jgi:hypothetical protein